jgi:type IV secretory pathway protease TraF
MAEPSSGRKSVMFRGRWLAVAAAVVVGGLVLHTWVTGQHTTLNLSGSLPQWAFSCRPYNEAQPLGLDMYVRFRPPVRVVARLQARGVDVNPAIPWIKQVTMVWDDADGQAMLVEGTAPDSFDSRQWGPLRTSEIQEVCVPWW